MDLNSDLTQAISEDSTDLRLAQASLPTGYSSTPAYTIKIVEQGVQFIREEDDRVYQNQTLSGAIATSAEGNPIDVAVQSWDGQVRIIAAGTPLTGDNLKDGDRLYFPQPQQDRTHIAHPPAPQPQQDISQLSTTDKLIEAMGRSVDKVDDEFRESLQAFLQPETLAVMAGVIAVWGASHLVGVGQAADVALLGAGAIALGADVVTAAHDLYQYFEHASNAQTPQDLEQAAQHFAEFVNLVGVSALSALVGAKLGQVTDDLARLVQNNWSKVADLGVDAQRAVGSLLKSGSTLLEDTGRHLDDLLTDGQRLFNQGLNKIDNLLTQLEEGLGIRSPQMEVAGVGPLDPGDLNSPMQMQGRGVSAGGTVQQLQQQGIPSNLINALEQRGLPPQQLEQAVKQWLSSGHLTDEIPQLVRTLDALADSGIDLRKAQQMLADSPREVVEMIEILMLGRGQLDNPQALQEQVSEINKLIDNPEKRADLIAELQVAVEHVHNGSRVQLGAVQDPSITPERVAQINLARRQARVGREDLKTVVRGGDVVDFTRREVIQLKNVISRTADGIWPNLRKADAQLRGLHGELPHDGFRKVAEIRIGPNNELFNENGQAINNLITQRIDINNELTEFDGIVRIVKQNERGVPVETLQFRVQNGRSQYSPSTSQSTRQSSLESDRSILSARTVLTAESLNSLATPDQTPTSRQKSPETASPQTRDATAAYSQLANTLRVTGTTATPAIIVAAHTIRATDDTRQARDLIAASPEAQQLAADPDAQARYVDDTVRDGISLALNSQVRFTQLDSTQIAPTPASELEPSPGYVDTFTDALAFYFEHNSDPLSQPNVEGALLFALETTVETHPTATPEQLQELTDFTLENFQPQLDPVIATSQPDQLTV